MNSKERKAQAKVRKAETDAALARLAALNEQDGLPSVVVEPAPKRKAKDAPKTTDGLPALPRLPRLPRKPKTPQICSCGCGQATRGGRFVPGHDARLHAWALRVERKQVKPSEVPAPHTQAVADLLKAGWHAPVAK